MAEPAVCHKDASCSQMCQILSNMINISHLHGPRGNIKVLLGPPIQPAKVVISTDESAAQASPSHSTSVPPLWRSVFTVFQFLPDSHLPLPRLPSILSSITWGLYFLERRQKRRQGANLTLTSILSSPLLLFLVFEEDFKVPRERQGSAGHLVNIREPRPSLKPSSHVAWLEFSWGKGMMGFFCCSQSHSSHLKGWMCRSYDFKTGGRDEFWG